MTNKKKKRRATSPSPSPSVASMSLLIGIICVLVVLMDVHVRLALSYPSSSDILNGDKFEFQQLLPPPSGGGSDNNQASRRQVVQHKQQQLQQQQQQRRTICWFMTYPNSGTSYTLNMVEELSHTTTASNYGIEMLVNPETTMQDSISIFHEGETGDGDDDSGREEADVRETTTSSNRRRRGRQRKPDTILEGPFWHGQVSSSSTSTGGGVGGDASKAMTPPAYKEIATQTKYKRHAYPLPSTSSPILTKTHCIDPCIDCSPVEYMTPFHQNSVQHFISRCAKSSGIKVNTRDKIPKTMMMTRRSNGTTTTTTNSTAPTTTRRRQRRFLAMEYSPIEHVSSALHLIRNPFHNVIARCHYYAILLQEGFFSSLDDGDDDDDDDDDDDEKKEREQQKQQLSSSHLSAAEKFRNFCKKMDAKYYNDDVLLYSDFFAVVDDGDGGGNDGNVDEDDHQLTLNDVLNVPCHGEFYKYVQWHNRFHDSIARLRQQKQKMMTYDDEQEQEVVPTLTIYYEDYVTNFNVTVDKIFDFLQLPKVGEVVPFADNNKKKITEEYDLHHFTLEERRLIRKFVKYFASDITWNEIQRYFL